MNATHVHLLITHLPLYGILMGVIVLAYAILKKSSAARSAAYLVFIVAAIGGAIAYYTGESAEHTAEEIQGVSEDNIEEHEDAAVFALGGAIVLGVLSIAGLLVDSKNAPLAPKFAIAILLVAIFCFTVVARTAYLGGMIRHTEIHQS